MLQPFQKSKTLSALIIYILQKCSAEIPFQKSNQTTDKAQDAKRNIYITENVQTLLLTEILQYHVMCVFFLTN